MAMVQRRTSRESRMRVVHARTLVGSSVWDGCVVHGIGRSPSQTVPFRAIHNRAFGLRKGCRAGTRWRVWRETSLQMGGSAYGIRTRVTAVRGRPEGLSDRDQRSASGHGKSQELWPFAAKMRCRFPNATQRSQSRTEDLGCRMIADGARRAVQVRPTRYRPSMAGWSRRGP